jgi:hypothetical protein
MERSADSGLESGIITWGEGCGPALSADSKAGRHHAGVQRGRCGKPPAGMGSAVCSIGAKGKTFSCQEASVPRYSYDSGKKL